MGAARFEKERVVWTKEEQVLVFGSALARQKEYPEMSNSHALEWAQGNFLAEYRRLSTSNLRATGHQNREFRAWKESRLQPKTTKQVEIDFKNEAKSPDIEDILAQKMTEIVDILAQNIVNSVLLSVRKELNSVFFERNSTKTDKFLG